MAVVVVREVLGVFQAHRAVNDPDSVLLVGPAG